MSRSCIGSGAVTQFTNTNFFLATVVVFLFSVINTSTVYASRIIELSIKGPIGPATADYISKGISRAQKADLIIVTIDTPGGLDASTRLIMQQFLSSAVPIAAYVSPNGARAASAGTYLLYASTIAAMAPGTELGAASPVALGEAVSGDGSKESAEHKKMMNDALATIRTLAQFRNRDSVFAEKAVLSAASMTSSEALHAKVINYVAADIPDLLQQLNGVTVWQNYKKITLNTSKPQIEHIAPGWITQFLLTITNPTIAYMLLLLGIYGIFFELFNPGFILPGVIGALALLVALYALQLLPINYVGFGLIVLGVFFMIAEGFTPSFGILGLGGTVAFVLGSLMLINTHAVGYQIAWSVIAIMALLNILFFGLLVGAVVKSRNQEARNGLLTLIGAVGRTLGPINLHGQAVIRGEIWSVYSNVPIAADKNIKVIHAEGLVLEVEEESNQGE